MVGAYSQWGVLRVNLFAFCDSNGLFILPNMDPDPDPGMDVHLKWVQ